MPYNRAKAVEYALNYALSPNPAFRYFSLTYNAGGDCTNFISQCLLAGGAEMIYDKNPWWYNHSNISSSLDDSWSLSWSIAHSLYWNIRKNTVENTEGIKAQVMPSADMLDLGDIIFYQNDENRIFHSTIVTDYNNGSPLVCQHTYDLKNVSYIKPYRVKEMHFMHIFFS